jgi:hypothetical protein
MMNKKLLIGAFALFVLHLTASTQEPPGFGQAKIQANNEGGSAPAKGGNKVNIFSTTGFSGIGTLSPTAPLEIKKNAGNTRNKNILLKLSNDWADNGQNEPSIMFSNGDVSNSKNFSYWTLGARVSGDKSSQSPQTFKVSFKPINESTEKEYFSIDSYEGRVKIGDVSTQVDGYKLYVEQGILTEKVKVAVKTSKDWYDQVFDKDYSLMPLNKLDEYIKANKHLPGIQTTEQVMAEGLDLGKMNALLLKKIEELTLYTIELKKELDETKKLIKKNN